MAVISQSEVDAFLSCRRRHFYAHGEKIAPIQFSDALTRGTIGHEALEKAFTAKKEGTSDRTKLGEIAKLALAPHMKPETIHLITELSTLLGYFFQHAEWIDHWEILEVEKEYRLEVPGRDNLTFPFKLDLLIRDRSAGNGIFVVDNKFVQDFYSDDLVGILPQMPKYVGALRRLGIPVKDAYYNMIRTRPLINKPVSDKLKLQRLFLKDQKIEHYMREQFSAMIQIKALQEQVTLDEWRDNYALRSANQFNCRQCPFRDLCYLDLHDGNRDLHIRSFYQPNTYGYEEEVKEKENVEATFKVDEVSFSLE